MDLRRRVLFNLLDEDMAQYRLLAEKNLGETGGSALISITEPITKIILTFFNPDPDRYYTGTVYPVIWGNRNSSSVYSSSNTTIIAEFITQELILIESPYFDERSGYGSAFNQVIYTKVDNTIGVSSSGGQSGSGGCGFRLYGK